MPAVTLWRQVRERRTRRRGEALSIRGNRGRRRLEPLYSSLEYMDRRTFEKLSGLSAAALLIRANPYAAVTVERSRFSDYSFNSGNTLPDRVVLWTRLAPDPLNGGRMPDEEVSVLWQVAEDEGFKKVVQTGTEYARIELAHSVTLRSRAWSHVWSTPTASRPVPRSALSDGPRRPGGPPRIDLSMGTAPKAA